MFNLTYKSIAKLTVVIIVVVLLLICVGYCSFNRADNKVNPTQDIGMTIYIGNTNTDGNPYTELYLYTKELRVIWGDAEYIFNNSHKLNDWLSKFDIQGIELWSTENNYDGEYIDVIRINRL